MHTHQAPSTELPAGQSNVSDEPPPPPPEGASSGPLPDPDHPVTVTAEEPGRVVDASDHECDGTNIAIAEDGRVYCAHCGWNQPLQAEPRVEGAAIAEDAAAATPNGPVPVAEAFAHAMAAQAHQAAASAGPVDEPARPAKLPFPRPPFDVQKHLKAIFKQRATIRGLTVDVLKADESAKRAGERKKAAHEALATAHEELETLVGLLEEDATADREPVQQALREPGRTPCSWERQHPGQVCTICSSTVIAAEHLPPIDGAGSDRLQLAPRNNESLRDALAAVGFEGIPIEEIESWTEEQYREAEAWAVAEHAKAHDDGVVVPPLPEILATAGDPEPDDDELEDDQVDDEEDDDSGDLDDDEDPDDE